MSLYIQDIKVLVLRNVKIVYINKIKLLAGVNKL